MNITYRIDTLATGTQRTAVHLFSVNSVKAGPDITTFMDINGSPICACPTANIAYVQEAGTAYRIDTLATVTQRTVMYLYNAGIVANGADITVFFDPNNNPIALCPVSANTAYVAI